MRFARRLDDVKSNSLAAGECNQRGAWVTHQRRADRLAGAWHKLQDIARNARLPQDVTHDLGDSWRLLRGLHHCTVSSDERCNSHARANCQREIPWTDDRCHTARLVPLLIKFTDEIAKACSTKQRRRFTCVILAEVNRFAHIGIGFAPRLSAFANQNRREFIATRAHQGCSTNNRRGAFRVRGVAPTWECSISVGSGARGVCNC